MTARGWLAPVFAVMFALWQCMLCVPAQAQQTQNAWDFYGDGNTGILWFNTQSNDVYLWDIDDTNIVSQGYITTGIASGWQVVATGYFNANHDLGLVWFNTQTGDVYLWDMQGTNIVNQGYISTDVPAGWQIVGTADFYGDGNTDLLWFNASTGDVYLWDISDTSAGINIVNQGSLAADVSPGWQVAGTGYFDAAGDPGIVWFNSSSRDVYLWDVHEGRIVNQGYIATDVSAGWQIAGIGYFNQASHEPGIVWFNASTGDVYLWDVSDTSDGIGIANQGYIATDVSGGWEIAGIRNDANSPYGEIVWYNTQSSGVYLWDVSDNGTSIGIASQGYLAQTTSPGWEIVNTQQMGSTL